jgi:hypothetical protein
MKMYTKISDWKIPVPCGYRTHLILSIAFILLVFPASARLGMVLSGFFFIGSWAFFLETISIASMNQQTLLQLPKNRLVGDVASLKRIVGQYRNIGSLCFCSVLALASGAFLCTERIVFFIFLIVFWAVSYFACRMLYHKMEEKVLSPETFFPFLKNAFSAFIIYAVSSLLLIVCFIIIKGEGELLADEMVLMGGGIGGSQALVIHILRVNSTRRDSSGL